MMLGDCKPGMAVWAPVGDGWHPATVQHVRGPLAKICFLGGGASERPIVTLVTRSETQLGADRPDKTKFCAARNES